jgi:zinc/manganese transport system substrate-binding protein
MLNSMYEKFVAAAFVILMLVTSGNAIAAEAVVDNKPNTNISQHPSTQKIPVMTSFTILSDIVENIGGDKVIVRSIIGYNQDLHDYAVKPSDLINVQISKILFLNGCNLEASWINMLSRTYKGAIVNVTDHMKNPLHIKHVTINDNDDKNENKISEIGHNAAAQLIDPHAWNDPTIVIDTYIPNIVQALCTTDPVNCNYYKTNAVRYITILKNLDSSIKKQLSVIPTAQRQAIVTHDAFGYYTRRYNINFIPAYGISEWGMSAKNVVALKRLIGKYKVKTLFLEGMTNNKVMQEIANDNQIKIGGKLYSESLSKSGLVADSYVHMLQANTATLVAAWRE